MFYKKNNHKALYSAAVFFAAALAVNAAPLWAQDSQGSGDDQSQAVPVVTVAPDNYCHTKFRPSENNLGGEDTQLGNAPDDWIDYSGPCDQASMDDAEKQLREFSADD